jgi:hypothetical protein
VLFDLVRAIFDFDSGSGWIGVILILALVGQLATWARGR